MDRRFRHALLLDWSKGGHDLSYLQASLEVMEKMAERVSVASPFSQESFSVSGQSEVAFYSVRMDRSVRFSRLRKNPLATAAESNGRRLRQQIESERSRIDMAFFPTIHDWEGGYWTSFLNGLDRDWMGLAMSWRSLRKVEPGDGMAAVLRDPRCRGIGILDEGRLDRAKELSGQSAVEILPDFVDPVEATDSRLLDRLRILADGRPIVLMIGQLNPRKGLREFGEIALRPEMKGHFFAMVGQYVAGRFDENDRRFLEGSLATAENVYFHPFGISGDGEYEALLGGVDLIYARFPDFPYSSNTLSHAASCGVPVLVHSGELLADRVREFCMGEVAGSVDESIACIQKMTTKESDGQGLYREGLSRYASTVTREQYQEKLQGLLAGYWRGSCG